MARRALAVLVLAAAAAILAAAPRASAPAPRRPLTALAIALAQIAASIALYAYLAYLLGRPAGLAPAALSASIASLLAGPPPAYIGAFLVVFSYLATAFVLTSRASTRAGRALWPLSLASLLGLLYGPLALLQLSAFVASAIEAYASLRG